MLEVSNYKMEFVLYPLHFLLGGGGLCILLSGKTQQILEK